MITPLPATLRPAVIKRSTVSREEATYEFSVAQVLYALRIAGMLPEATLPARDSAHAWVDVPTGGDYSGIALDLEDHPLNVRVVTETRTP
jgi:hypothetical protein